MLFVFALERKGVCMQCWALTSGCTIFNTITLELNFKSMFRAIRAYIHGCCVVAQVTALFSFGQLLFIRRLEGSNKHGHRAEFLVHVVFIPPPFCGINRLIIAFQPLAYYAPLSTYLH